LILPDLRPLGQDRISDGVIPPECLHGAFLAELRGHGPRIKIILRGAFQNSLPNDLSERPSSACQEKNYV
jgi:hypothetical protein